MTAPALSYLQAARARCYPKRPHPLAAQQNLTSAGRVERWWWLQGLLGVELTTRRSSLKSYAAMKVWG